MNKPEALRLALEALEMMRQKYGEYACSAYDNADAAITALRAALAQQDEPVEEHKHWCASLTQLLLSDPPKRAPCDCKKKQAEPVKPVDVGLLEYRGNSVAFIHQKMTAYRAGIDAAWDAFRANGLHPDGKTSLADMIAKHTAPPQRKPLTEDVAALTAQRDALLEALKKMRIKYGEYACRVCDQADAAIKAVEETK